MGQSSAVPWRRWKRTAQEVSLRCDSACDFLTPGFPLPLSYFIYDLGPLTATRLMSFFPNFQSPCHDVLHSKPLLYWLLFRLVAYTPNTRAVWSRDAFASRFPCGAHAS